ncbi:MAG: hypothetical protein ACYC54_08860 [Sedimentisphaerales bacterium]
MKYREISKRKKNYNYELAETISIQTGILGCNVEIPKFVRLTPDGILTVFAGYAWDGASGIPDSKITRTASLIHDALYQLIREGLLSREKYRIVADNIFRDICIARGGNKTIAGIYWQGLRWFGEKATYPVKNDLEPVIEDKDIILRNVA